MSDFVLTVDDLRRSLEKTWTPEFIRKLAWANHFQRAHEYVIKFDWAFALEQYIHGEDLCRKDLFVACEMKMVDIDVRTIEAKQPSFGIELKSWGQWHISEKQINGPKNSYKSDVSKVDALPYPAAAVVTCIFCSADQDFRKVPRFLDVTDRRNICYRSHEDLLTKLRVSFPMIKAITEKPLVANRSDHPGFDRFSLWAGVCFNKPAQVLIESTKDR